MRYVDVCGRPPGANRSGASAGGRGKPVAGFVALVLRDGKPVYERAAGWRDKEAGCGMTTDTIFRIASQTKAITSTAILMLVEEGKIGLE